MQHRTLGKTGFQFSTVGFGCWGIGGTMWIGAEDESSLAALHRAIELDCTFFDTALVYGQGHSEQLVGQVYRECDGKTASGRPIHIATKVPPQNFEWPARNGAPWNETFPPDHIVDCCHTSLKNLGLDCVDLLQLHVWQDAWLEHADAWYPAVEQLKADGKIRAFGISINDYQPTNAIKAVESGIIDSVQVIYNIFAQAAQDELFAATQQHEVGVIIRVGLDEGGLTGNITPATTFPKDDFRNRYFAGDRKNEVAMRVEKLQPLVQEAQAANIAELALRYCISHPAVTSVIPGMRTPARVSANAKASDDGALPPNILTALQAHRWERNWYLA